jgi:hypothetical protein
MSDAQPVAWVEYNITSVRCNRRANAIGSFPRARKRVIAESAIPAHWIAGATIKGLQQEIFRQAVFPPKRELHVFILHGENVRS